MLKTVSSVTNALGALNYKGTWDASTNNPTLTSSVGTKGDYYVVSVAGNTNLNGTTLWGVGDWAVFNGSIWQKVDGGDTGNLTSLTVTSLTGYMYANNTSPVTASTTIPVAVVTGAVPNTVNVIAGTGLSGGGALTGNVTVNLANTAVTAGVYGNGTNVPQITVDAQGRITGASNVVITNQGTVTNVATGTGLTGGPITSTGTISLANTAVTAGTYGNATAVSQVVVDAQGRITSASNVVISSVTIGNTAVAPGGTATTVGNLTVTNVTISSGSLAANVVNHTGTTSNTGNGISSMLVAPANFLIMNINGVSVKVPYYT